VGKFGDFLGKLGFQKPATFVRVSVDCSSFLNFIIIILYSNFFLYNASSSSGTQLCMQHGENFQNDFQIGPQEEGGGGGGWFLCLVDGY
jgi:hypothetical protein